MRLPLRRLLPAVLLLPTLAACSSTSDREDCQTLMSQRKYARVLQRCDSPYERSSARLGLMGFDIYQVLTQPTGAPVVITALGLTPANINTKRLQVNAAVNEVRPPSTPAEAYAALLSSFLGLSTTVSQFLDNGAGGQTALDDVFAGAEVEAATGMTTGGASGFDAKPSSVAHYSVVVGGLSYIVVCNDVLAPLDVTHCDDDPPGTLFVYDDPEGAGLFDPGTPGTPSALPIASLATATQADLVLHITNMVLPITLDAVQTPVMQEFLSQGDPAGTYDIGVLAYLDLMDTADQVIIDAAGGTAAKSPISDYISEVRSLLDNGASCMSTLDPSGTIAFFLDTLAPIETAAAGTAAHPVPVPIGSPAPAGFYQNYNAPASLDLSSIGLPALDPNNYVWKNTVPAMHYKLLYPKVQPGAAYSAVNATPRVDEADPAFRSALDALPELSPALAGTGDGRVNFIELLCVGN